MRMVPTKTGQGNKDVKQSIILHQRPTPKPLERGQFNNYKLCTIPAYATSPLYKLLVPFFESGTPKEWILFRRGLIMVLKGQNITQGPPSYA
eukprot:6162712-Ditylum_brightwellii.AAC.1